jgi:xanthine dehydrogenase YagR molybdenum-binding subunit
MAKRKVSVVESGIEKEIEIDVPDDISGGWGDPKSHHVIGHRVTRIEGNQKVTGSAKYTYDINLPGLLYARVLRSPYPAAKVESIDVSATKRLPGVKAVLTYEGKTIRFAGEEVAAVAAETDYIAQDAIRLIKVNYKEMPFVVREEKAKNTNSPQVFSGEDNIRQGRPKNDGDINTGFQNATAIVEATYRTQVQTHACLETHGAVAKWDGNHLTVWCSTQAISAVKNELVSNLGLKGSQVRVICEHMGGGFGSKFGAGSYGIMAAKLAQQADAPVKLMLTRNDEFLCVGNRPSSIQKNKSRRL